MTFEVLIAVFQIGQAVSKRIAKERVLYRIARIRLDAKESTREFLDSLEKGPHEVETIEAETVEAEYELPDEADAPTVDAADAPTVDDTKKDE